MIFASPVHMSFHQSSATLPGAPWPPRESFLTSSGRSRISFRSCRAVFSASVPFVGSLAKRWVRSSIWDVNARCSDED